MKIETDRDRDLFSKIGSRSIDVGKSEIGDRNRTSHPLSSLILSRTHYGNTTLAGILPYLLQQLQSVMNLAARLMFSSSRYDRITSLFHQLHWLRVPERIQFKLAVLVYKCLNKTADELRHTADFRGLRCLRSASSLSLNVRRTRLSTIGKLLLLPVLGTVRPNTSRPQPL